MKNIHILPTDQPSRLFKFANKLHLDTIPKDYYKKYNIYLTSDEEIKEGDWCTDGSYLIQATTKLVGAQGLFDRRDWKKIILSTDPTLITDGVQAIDDEFLEWFVKNPTCEFIKVTKLDYLTNRQYRIYNLPQEELKSFSDFSDKFFGTTEKEESKQTEIMYSEQEVLDLLYKRDLYLFNRDETKELELPTEWFEKFKKK